MCRMSGLSFLDLLKHVKESAEETAASSFPPAYKTDRTINAMLTESITGDHVPDNDTFTHTDLVENGELPLEQLQNIFSSIFRDADANLPEKSNLMSPYTAPTADTPSGTVNHAPLTTSTVSPALQPAETDVECTSDETICPDLSQKQSSVSSSPPEFSASSNHQTRMQDPAPVCSLLPFVASPKELVPISTSAPTRKHGGFLDLPTPPDSPHARQPSMDPHATADTPTTSSARADALLFTALHFCRTRAPPVDTAQHHARAAGQERRTLGNIDDTRLQAVFPDLVPATDAEGVVHVDAALLARLRGQTPEPAASASDGVARTAMDGTVVASIGAAVDDHPRHVGVVEVLSHTRTGSPRRPRSRSRSPRATYTAYSFDAPLSASRVGASVALQLLCSVGESLAKAHAASEEACAPPVVTTTAGELELEANAVGVGAEAERATVADATLTPRTSTLPTPFPPSLPSAQPLAPTHSHTPVTHPPSVPSTPAAGSTHTSRARPPPPIIPLPPLPPPPPPALPSHTPAATAAQANADTADVPHAPATPQQAPPCPPSHLHPSPHYQHQHQHYHCSFPAPHLAREQLSFAIDQATFDHTQAWAARAATHDTYRTHTTHAPPLPAHNDYTDVLPDPAIPPSGNSFSFFPSRTIPAADITAYARDVSGHTVPRAAVVARAGDGVDGVVISIPRAHAQANFANVDADPLFSASAPALANVPVPAATHMCEQILDQLLREHAQQPAQQQCALIRAHGYDHASAAIPSRAYCDHVESQHAMLGQPEVAVSSAVQSTFAPRSPYPISSATGPIAANPAPLLPPLPPARAHPYATHRPGTPPSRYAVAPAHPAPSRYATTAPYTAPYAPPYAFSASPYPYAHTLPPSSSRYGHAHAQAMSPRPGTSSDPHMTTYAPSYVAPYSASSPYTATSSYGASSPYAPAIRSTPTSGAAVSPSAGTHAGVSATHAGLDVPGSADASAVALASLALLQHSIDTSVGGKMDQERWEDSGVGISADLGGAYIDRLLRTRVAAAGLPASPLPVSPVRAHQHQQPLTHSYTPPHSHTPVTHVPQMPLPLPLLRASPFSASKSTLPHTYAYTAPLASAAHSPFTSASTHVYPSSSHMSARLSSPSRATPLRTPITTHPRPQSPSPPRYAVRAHIDGGPRPPLESPAYPIPTTSMFPDRTKFTVVRDREKYIGSSVTSSPRGHDRNLYPAAGSPFLTTMPHTFAFPSPLTNVVNTPIPAGPRTRYQK